MCTKRPTPASRAAAMRFRVPSTMIRWNCLRLALADRDEVDDRVAARHGRAQALRVGHVSLDELAAPGLEPLAAAPVADEAADVLVVRAERVHDVPADEAVRRR